MTQWNMYGESNMAIANIHKRNDKSKGMEMDIKRKEKFRYGMDASENSSVIKEGNLQNTDSERT